MAKLQEQPPHPENRILLNLMKLASTITAKSAQAIDSKKVKYFGPSFSKVSNTWWFAQGINFGSAISYYYINRMTNTCQDTYIAQAERGDSPQPKVDFISDRGKP